MRPEVAEFARVVKHAIPIPRGTKPASCRGPRCTTTVYFVGNRCVSIEKYGTNPPGVAPTDTQDGIGIDHHADCIDRAMFRKTR